MTVRFQCCYVPLLLPLAHIYQSTAAAVFAAKPPVLMIKFLSTDACTDDTQCQTKRAIAIAKLTQHHTSAGAGETSVVLPCYQCFARAPY